MQQNGPAFDQHLPHLDPVQVQAGDSVIGTLPVNLAAQVCERGDLVLEMPAQQRGQELRIQDLQVLGATLQPFHVQLQKVKPAS